ncbi:hypothetical protein [Saccharopolyspora sp. NPDC050642]|uniref:hypothetical protein n=1 Tax=Saccharopolyspora sp. NPDC050642 TaxID=3157099 RepID=UPI0033C5FAD1
MRQQGEHAVADQFDGRFVARDQQQLDGADQLPFGEPVVLVGGDDQRAHQVRLVVHVDCRVVRARVPAVKSTR